MRNLWSDSEAEAAVARHAEDGIGEDLALRAYTARLLGREPGLVLHGGGNSSVKTRAANLWGEVVEALCVKASGRDMATIQPDGHPALDLAALRRAAALDTLDEVAMVALLRASLLDPAGPGPSVETLLHAFLPHKFVDHTHANAVLSLTDQPDGAAFVAEVFGDRAAAVPYVMPGFGLAQAARAAYEASPACHGLILLKHGIVSFGASARESYTRMIELVSMAEARLDSGPRTVFAAVSLPVSIAAVAAVGPILRGVTAPGDRADDGLPRRFVLAHRGGGRVLDYVAGAEVARYSQAGVATPDHAIRTKPKPLLLPPPEADGLEGFASAARAAVAAYRDDYLGYFARHGGPDSQTLDVPDPMPRVALVPGLGLFALGASAAEAGITADIAEAAIEVISGAETIGTFESITEAETFAIEYWPPERAKLADAAPLPLAGRVALVTGGAGEIGAAIAATFAEAGAEVVLLDRDGAGAERAAGAVGGLGLACDVTDPVAVHAACDRACEAYGGIDILVSNAGAAWQGRIGEVSDAVLRESFELNFFAHQAMAREAVRIIRAQGGGGVLLFNASKQALNPGPDFGPYGLPKAATLSLMRQYAVDYGRDGIRSNAVNADRIRSGLLTDEMIAARAGARGVSEAEYLAGNLLGREVRAKDVAHAFLSLALAPATTGAVLTVDGGNIAAAPR